MAGLTLHIAEGEKCADALAECGLVASTSQGGSGATQKTDWTPAARFATVYIWQDVDATNADTGINPGVKYAETVAKLILKSAECRVQSAERAVPDIFIVDLRAYWVATTGKGGDEFNGRDVYDLIAEKLAQGHDQAVIGDVLLAIAEQYSRWVGEVAEMHYPGQPKLLGADPSGTEKRPEIRNFEIELGSEKPTPFALTMDVVREQVQGALQEWPCRIYSPGSDKPLLFVDDGRGEARILPKSIGFEAFLHERGRVGMCDGQDKRLNNFISINALYHSFGGSRHIQEYKSIEAYPHEPLMQGHYYTWRAPAGYRADGRRLGELLGLVKNFEAPEVHLLFAAALCTPFWGGPYKERPGFIFTAPDKNCGKTTAATLIGKLCGGVLSIALDAKQEAQIKERLLSPSALSTRVVLADNVKKALDSQVLEELLTAEQISGKRMYYGDATRPNNLTYLLTANMPTVSRDLILRSFFIGMTRPEKDSDWARKYNKFLARHKEEVVCDILRLLKGPMKFKKLKPPGDERYPLWLDEVLNRVMADEAVAAAVGVVDYDKVLLINEKKREEHDEDRRQARMLWDGLVSNICESNEWGKQDLYSIRPKLDVPVTAAELRAYWAKIFGREVNHTWLAGRMHEHMSAGRIPGIVDHRTPRGVSTYYVGVAAVNAYLDSCERESQVNMAQSGDVALAGEVGAVSGAGSPESVGAR